MKKALHITATLLLAVLTTGCIKEMSTPDGQKLTVTASFADNQAKTTLLDGGTQVFWEPGDEIKVFYGSGSGKFTSSNSELAATAEFTGSIDSAEGTYMWGVYPYRSDTSFEGDIISTCLPCKQTGKAGSFSSGQNLSIARSSNHEFFFYNVCGGVRFSLTHEGVKKVVFSGNNDEPLAGNISLTFYDSYPVVIDKDYQNPPVILSLPDDAAFEVGKWYYIVALPTLLEKGYTMRFQTDTQFALLQSSNSVSINRAVFGSIENADAGLTYQDCPNAGEAVDLGLSVKWATCNVGASSPEEYGRYFAWGDVVGQTWNGSEWSGGGFYKNYPEYEVDTNGNLKPEYDAARVNLGGTWRMPTETEWQELIDNCSSTWTKNYIGTGVAGNIFTSKKEGYTDKSIFLPAAGGDFNYYIPDGTYGYFWSSTFYSSSRAWNLFSMYDSVFTSDVYRNFGLSVRPVLASNDATELTLDKSEISITEGALGRLTVTTQPSDATNIIQWSSSDSNVAMALNSGMIYGVREGKCTVTAMTSIGKKAECSVTVTGMQSCMEYVDLGLDVKWATCNIGALSPEDFGCYFAWGETEIKDEYDMSTYKWTTDSGYTFTKYNNNPDSKEFDDKDILDPEDDAAHEKWGTNWRIPTVDDWIDLAYECNWIWTAVNGIDGYRVTSNVYGYTDKSIFLPVAGRRLPTYNTIEDICNGHYTTSNLFGNDFNYSHYLYFSSEYVDYSGAIGVSRCIGLPIRPVYQPQKNEDGANEGVDFEDWTF